jgi:hypothetical protein
MLGAAAVDGASLEHCMDGLILLLSFALSYVLSVALATGPFAGPASSGTDNEANILLRGAADASRLRSPTSTESGSLRKDATYADFLHGTVSQDASSVIPNGSDEHDAGGSER